MTAILNIWSPDFQKRKLPFQRKPPRTKKNYTLYPYLLTSDDTSAEGIIKGIKN